MVDPSIIKNTYAAMGNEELILFAKEEGDKLSSTAFTLLKEEFERRSLDMTAIKELENTLISKYFQQTEKLEGDFSSDIYRKVWDYAFDEKLKGNSNYNIHRGLQDMGIASEYAYYVINNLKAKAVEIKDDSKTGIIAGVVLLILGFVFVYASFAIERFEAAAFVVVIIGMVRTVISIIRNTKISRVIETLSAEESSTDESVEH